MKRFDSPSEAWLDFVAANRYGQYFGVRYDLIMGPVANDDVYATIGLYMRGFEQKLWHHSPQLLASLVEEELRTGKFTYPQEAL